MKKFFNKIFLILNIIFIGLLFLGYLSSVVNPVKIWFLAFFGLSYPYILIFNILFIVFWLFRKPVFTLFSIISILIGFQFFSRTFQLNFSKEKSNNTNSVKIISYNVRLFDLYNWTKKNNTPDKVLNYIVSEEPDIFCFQEFICSTTKPEKDYKVLKKYENANYSHFAYTRHWKNRYYGIVTFSKYPIINKGEIPFENTHNISIFSDIKIGSDTIRLYNLHLQSIRFNSNNYQYLDTMNFNYDKKNIAQIEDIARRMKNAFQKRSEQVATLALHMKNSPYKIVICGDFNDTPVSYTYNELKAELVDAFVESGHGFENSFTGIFPHFRIDYIFHDNEIQSFDYRTLIVDFSDHYPISCRLLID